MSEPELRSAIERYDSTVPLEDRQEALRTFRRLMAALNAGTVRAAERCTRRPIWAQEPTSA